MQKALKLTWALTGTPTAAMSGLSQVDMIYLSSLTHLRPYNC